MNILEWAEKYKVVVNHFDPNNCKWVLLGNANKELFHLEDWHVCGIAGGTVWLSNFLPKAMQDHRQKVRDFLKVAELPELNRQLEMRHDVGNQFETACVFELILERRENPS